MPAAGTIGRRAVLGGGLAASLVPLLPRVAGATSPTTTIAPSSAATPASPIGRDGGRDFGFKPPQPAGAVYVRPIVFPVIGSVTWSDTYLAPRAGGRHHEGQDLIGPKMLKLVAAVAGTVVELVWGPSGNALYLQGDDGWYYCYLHINNDTPGTDDNKNDFQYAFAPGMAIGTRVAQGQHVAYLGDSGDAEGGVSHLHFEIRMPDAHWYNASAVNPKYSLDQAGQVVAASTFAPWTTAADLVRQQWRDIFGVEASASEVGDAASRLNTGAVSPEGLIGELLGQPGSEDVVAPVVRLYLASFPRVPDPGLRYWIDQVRAGATLSQVADRFSNTSEFRNRFANLSNQGFITRIYRDLFNRAPDPGGKAYWSSQLSGGMSRGSIVNRLAESDEYRFVHYTQVRVVVIYEAMLRRSPDATGWLYWINQANTTNDGLGRCVKAIRLSSEYAQRVGR